MDRQMLPLSSPDTLRKTLKLLNRFYSGYTDKFKGYTDLNGYKYNGTVENFGSEMLIEARKLLMDKPPIELVFPGNTFNFYFNISYSELINTYEQQNMFVATLKDDVLRSNCVYKIIFRNCQKKYVLRSESYSDPDVFHDLYYMTSTKPELQITLPNGDIETVELMVSNNDTYDIMYSFNSNKTNESLIESFNENTGVLTLREITYRDINIPLIWIYSDAFNVLPAINFVNNEDVNHNTLLTIGTDGHDNSFLYPLIYEDNYPDTFDPEDGLTWFVKVLPHVDASFINDSSYDINYTSEVATITFIRSETPWSTPTISKTITYDNSYVKIFLDKNVTWAYHKPVQGDYDYDGMTYNNRTYAYIDLDDFVDNMDIDKPCTSLFRITFDETYLNPYESDLGNVVSGIHLEACSDYLENGVPKKSGIIHSLSEFDGVPKYYKMERDKIEHRSHVEMFAIRDFNNNSDIKVMDKQTAAIILDSAVPQRDLDSLLNNLEKVIVFNFASQREWFTVGESISKTNALSSLVYVDQDTSADDKIAGMIAKPHFIYHGNRYMSTDIMGLDPDLEYARGILLTNDPPSYENNDKTNYKKPLRTIARICDIPTDTSQLIHIAGVSPTIIIDPEYIRQYASMNDTDKDRLWNQSQNKWVTSNHELSSLGFYGVYDNLDMLLPITENTPYTVKTNLNTSIAFSECTIDVGNGGADYAVDDTFTFYIGGKLVTGIVTTELNGAVTSVTVDLDPLYMINIANLKSPITTFDTTTKNGTGTGLKIDVIIQQSTWDSLQPQSTSIPYDDLYTMKFDEYGFLWFWKYNTDLSIWEQNDQLTGPKITPNQYDDKMTLKKRSCGDVMLYNSLNVYSTFNYSESRYDRYYVGSSIPTTIPLDNILSFTGPNYQSSYYVLDEFPSGQGYTNYRITYWTPPKTGRNIKMLPAYNELNVSEHVIRGDSLQRYINDSYNQPVMYYYNPALTDKIDYSRYSSDVFKILNTKRMTYADIIDGYIDDGKTTAPIYRYNEFKPVSGYEDEKLFIDGLSHLQLINYITEQYPDSYVLKMEEFGEPLTDNELRMYIMSNWFVSPAYKIDDIYRTHKQNDTVIENGNPVGEAPSGDFMPIVETFRDKVNFNNRQYSSELTFIFKVEGEIDLTNFIIQNEDDIDVSSKSLILMNGHLYYYDNDNTWVMIP